MKDTIISFLGDISLNDHYNELYQRGEAPFVAIRDILFHSKLVVGNLESMAISDEGENILKAPRLSTNLETLDLLNELNVGLALLANNHVFDNLEEGFIRTTSFLKEHQIDYIGAGLSRDEAEKPFIKKIGGEIICILNYVTEDTNPNLPENATVHLNWFEEKKVISDIERYMPDCDKIILCLHWGGLCEGGFFPEWEQPKLARRLIDAGADLIIGGHSHTFQPFELYKEKYIFYSLGNFCFSDIKFGDKLIELEHGKNTESMIVSVKAEDNEWVYRFTPTDCQNLHISVNDSILEKVHMRNRLFKFIKKSKLFWRIYYFKLKYIGPISFYLLGNDRNFVKQLLKLDLAKIRRFLVKS